MIETQGLTILFDMGQTKLFARNAERFSGCSHRGILNIVSHFQPDVLVGGFHLSHIQPGQELSLIALQLNTFSTEYYTCHCTGLSQYRYMAEHMNRLHYLSIGQTITI